MRQGPAGNRAGRIIASAAGRRRPETAEPQEPQEPRTLLRPVAVPSAPPLLNSRERDVAKLVLIGLTYRQIGEPLFISAKTVKHHMTRIRKRWM